MTVRIRKNKPADGEVRRLLRFEIQEQRKQLVHWRRDRSAAIHGLRQSGHRVRAILRLVRARAPYAYVVEDQNQKEICRRFSYLRDADVMASTFAWLADRHPRLLEDASLREVGTALDERASRLFRSDIFRLDHRIDQALKAVDQAAYRAAHLPLDRVTRGSLRKAVRANRRKVEKAFITASAKARAGDFHRWRRQCRYAATQLAVTRRLNTALTPDERRQVTRIAKVLGREHDLTVLANWLMQPHRPARTQGRRAPLLEILMRERDIYRQRAFSRARDLFGHAPAADPVVVPFPTIEIIK